MYILSNKVELFVDLMRQLGFIHVVAFQQEKNYILSYKETHFVDLQ